MLNTSLITPEMNMVLCDLERINCMLMATNKQYRESQNKGLSEQTIKYFDNKLQFLSEYYNKLLEDISDHFLSVYYKDKNLVEERKETFKQLFAQEYSECKNGFDYYFNKYGDCNYRPFLEDFNNFALGKNTVKSHSFYNNYLKYASSQLINVHYENFIKLYNGNKSQNNEYGAKTTWGNLDKELREVPVWAVFDINKVASNKQIEYKTQLRKMAIKSVNLKKKIKSDETDVASLLQYNNLANQVRVLEKRITNANNVVLSSNNVAGRADCINSKWRYKDAGLISVVDNIAKFVVNVPKDILKLNNVRSKLIVMSEELDDIINLSKNDIEMLRETLVLAKANNKPLEYKLQNYEFSKKAISRIDEMYKENSKKILELNAKLQNSKLKQTQIESIKSELNMINDCMNSYDNVNFSTPFGIVKYSKGQLVNTVTNISTPINKIYYYRCINGKMLEKLNVDGKVIQKVQVNDMEKMLSTLYQSQKSR